MYSEILTAVSTSGLLTAVFYSGILSHRVRRIRVDLEDHKWDTRERCKFNHAGDKEVLQTLAKLVTQVEIIIAEQRELRSRLDQAIKTSFGKVPN